MNVDVTVTNLRGFTRKSDDTLEKKLAFIIRILKNDYIITLRILGLIRKPVTNHTISGHDGVFH